MEKCQSEYSNYLQAAGIQLRLVFKFIIGDVLASDWLRVAASMASHWLLSRPITRVIAESFI